MLEQNQEKKIWMAMAISSIAIIAIGATTKNFALAGLSVVGLGFWAYSQILALQIRRDKQQNKPDLVSHLVAMAKALDESSDKVSESIQKGFQDGFQKSLAEQNKQTLQTVAAVEKLGQLQSQLAEKQTQLAEKTLAEDVKREDALSKSSKAEIEAAQAQAKAQIQAADQRATQSAQELLSQWKDGWQKVQAQQVEQFKTQLENWYEEATVTRNAHQALLENAQTQNANFAGLREKWQVDLQQVLSVLNTQYQETLSEQSELAKAERENQNYQLASILAQSLQTWEKQAQQASDSFATKAEALQQATLSMQETVQKGAEKTLELLQTLEENAIRPNGELLESLLERYRLTMSETQELMQGQAQLGLELAQKVDGLAGNLQNTSGIFAEVTSLLQINQGEMQAGVSLLNEGLMTLLEKLDAKVESTDAEKDFVGQLNDSLMAFQEKSSELLLENTYKTQEILMEALAALSEARDQSLTTEN